VTDLLRLAGQAEAAAQAGTIMRIERQLAQAQWTRVQNRDPVATYNKVTAAEAAALAPGIDWQRFFAAAGVGAQPFIVRQPSFLTELGKLVRSVPVSDWQAYFRFHLLDTYAPLLPSAFEQRHFDFHQRTLSACRNSRRAGNARWRC
jgi:predicted metalloendopeptidase